MFCYLERNENSYIFYVDRGINRKKNGKVLQTYATLIDKVSVLFRLIPRSTEKMLDTLLELTENDIEKRPKTGAVQRDRQKIYRNNSSVGTTGQKQGTMSTTTARGRHVNCKTGLSLTLPNLKVNTKAWRILKDRHTIICGRRPLPVPQTTHTAMPLIRIWPPV